MKLCIDCAHFVVKDRNCKMKILEISLIDGKTDYEMAYMMRKSGECGKDAKLFDLKEKHD